MTDFMRAAARSVVLLVEEVSSEDSDFLLEGASNFEVIRWFGDIGAIDPSVAATLDAIFVSMADPVVGASRLAQIRNMPGFDRLYPDDPRLSQLVWSWAPDEEPDSSCAVMRADGRWAARPCGERHPSACRLSDGSAGLLAANRGNRTPAGCGLPRTGRENEVVRAAAGGRVVWLPLAPPRKKSR